MLDLDYPINEELVEDAVDARGKVEVLDAKGKAQPLSMDFLYEDFYESGRAKLLSHEDAVDLKLKVIITTGRFRRRTELLLLVCGVDPPSPHIIHNHVESEYVLMLIDVYPQTVQIDVVDGGDGII